MVYIITVDAKQDYQQVTVYKVHRRKIEFFAPNYKKYTFKVTPFDPMNVPSFYTCVMGKLRINWHALFLETVRKRKFIGGMTVRVTDTDEIYLNGIKTFSGIKGIIDDILTRSTNLDLILIYFECVCKVLKKHRVRFRLNKCELLKDRVEYVGHYLTPPGNVPEKSEFNIINDWKLPTSSQGLHYFISLVNVYHNYASYFEVRIKPLQKL